MIYILPSSQSTWIYKIIKWYYRKPRNISFNEIDLILYPTVFHPKLYLTTETFIDYFINIDFRTKPILELGCGSGVVSIVLARKYSNQIFASDINQNAVKGLIENKQKMGVNIEVIESDLFANIPDIQFGTILINPPFFNGEITSMDQYAFYTGLNNDYFHRLFKQLNDRKDDFDNIYMILTNKCDLEFIINLAESWAFKCRKIFQTSVYNEIHYIYSIV